MIPFSTFGLVFTEGEMSDFDEAELIEDNFYLNGKVVVDDDYQSALEWIYEKLPSFTVCPFCCVFRPNPATIPAGKRPPFRHESGQYSDSIPDTIPEQSGQCNLRV